MSFNSVMHVQEIFATFHCICPDLFSFLILVESLPHQRYKLMGHWMLSRSHLFTLMMIVFYLKHSENYAQIMNDRVSLLSFMSQITYDPENALQSWRNSTDSSPCNWSGVKCSIVTNRVVELSLSQKSLHGTVSPALFNLSQLEVLDLSDNFFEGPIPSELGSLYQLKKLSLAYNLLEGTIPGDSPGIGEMGFLGQLIYLNLASNRLEGEIPGSLLWNSSSSLEYLELSTNSLTGRIPLDNQCQLKRLEYLLLWSNSFVGEVPPALSNSSRLKWLDLGSNLLTGELPDKILSNNMPDLQYLYFSYNFFSSHNENNNLKPFFSSLINSSNLQEIDLAGNFLGGELPSTISNLSTLVLINLDTNLIRGEIPPQISSLVNLTLLNLSSNLLNGSIPIEVCKMRGLERLYLSNNSLSGEIPSAVGNMSHLGLLDLSKNKLSGNIPDTFANLQLRRLLLNENRLSGTIPPSLGQCINLELLDLSLNRISSTIPSEVAGLSSLKQYLNLSSNLLHGPLPLELSKMDMVQSIDLSSNNLSSGLPSQLGSCVALEYLNLSHNSLMGKFPASIGNLPYLRELDVSFNQFNGEIPQSLQASSTLKLLNFSYNNFTGNITNKGAFSSLTFYSVLGNDRLCGSMKGLRECRRRRAHHFLIAVLLSLFITPIFCITGYPLLSRSKLRNEMPVSNGKDIKEEGKAEEKQYPNISRAQLIEATGRFSSSNLIGSGSFGHVYKGVLQDNTRIAVKVLLPKEGGEISGSFKRECQVLKRTRHRNLIRIITACSRPDFKALVLPLMLNGSLEDHLYPINKLNLVQLVSICSDVAEGIAYLHHHAPTKVVHCDLKPGNILLDDDMTALVTDFGIARLVKGASDDAAADYSASYDSTDGLLCGSVGYIAPEYGMGRRASPEGDVYSYGVLLLEIVTGKRPTNLLLEEGSSMPEWIKRQYPNKLEPTVQQAISRCGKQALGLHEKKMWGEIILELIELGLICTQYNPAARPTMVDVAHEVKLLKNHLSSPSPSVIDHTSTSYGFS